MSKTIHDPDFNYQKLKAQLYLRAVDFFRSPKIILNITSKALLSEDGLSLHFPEAEIIHSDNLLPPKAPVDMILWHDIFDISGADFFKTIHQWLAPQGLFLFSTWGPGSQLKQQSLDMHDWGDALQRAHFETIVTDRQDIICPSQALLPWLMPEQKTPVASEQTRLELIIGHGISKAANPLNIPTKTITQPSPI